MARSKYSPRKIPVDCDSCRARIDGLCEGCAPEVLRVIASYQSGDRHVKAGQNLIRIGEPCDAIYNLVEGWMVRYGLLEDGWRSILQLALQGAVLGFHPAQGAMATHGGPGTDGCGRLHRPK
jgi:CRP-like cAMP-binding protein